MRSANKNLTLEWKSKIDGRSQTTKKAHSSCRTRSETQRSVMLCCKQNDPSNVTTLTSSNIGWNRTHYAKGQYDIIKYTMSLLLQPVPFVLLDLLFCWHYLKPFKLSKYLKTKTVLYSVMTPITAFSLISILFLSRSHLFQFCLCRQQQLLVLDYCSWEGEAD